MSRNSSRGVDRRLFLAGTAAALAAPTIAGAAPGDLLFYVGTYGDAGVQMVSYSTAYDKWTMGKADKTIVNASFGVYSPKFKRHYLVNEQENGLVGCYQVSSSGKWAKKGEVSSHGKSPCYLALSTDNAYLAVANYGSGNIAVYKLDSAGLPLEPAITKENSGSGPNAERQEGPHAHWVKFSADQKFIYSIDLGTDEVIGYPFDAATGAVGDKFVAFKCEPGFGPRHMVIHPSGQVAHLLGELANAVVTLRPQGDGTFAGTQWTKTLPDDFTGTSQAGHISYNADSNMLYVSNRGHNSIAVFGLDASGRLAPMQIAPSGGDWPRFFQILNGWDRLIVAHQNSNDLTIQTQYTNGTLHPSNQTLSIAKPVFVGAIS